MTTAPRSVAVVATRLPITDRRALSQAWYSALHVPQAQAGAVRPKTRSTALPGVAAARATAAATVAATPNAGSTQPRAGAARTAAVSTFPDRRVPASDVARRIERAVAARLPAAVGIPATVCIKAGDGRVQLLVRHDGTTTRIVALCAPHLRERVDRALAHARFALAAAGAPIAAA